MAGKISLAINILLIGAVIFLFMKSNCSSCSSNNESGSSIQYSDTTDNNGSLNIAFISVDSLMANFKLSKELSDMLISESNLIQGRITSKIDDVSRTAMAYQQEIELGLVPVTEQQYNDKMKAFDNEITSYQNSQKNKMQQLQYETTDSIWNVIDDYIADLVTRTNFDFILKERGSDPFFYRNDKYDLTEQVVNDLNQEFEKSLENDTETSE